MPFIEMRKDPFGENLEDNDRSKNLFARSDRFGSVRRPYRGIEIKEDTYAILKIIQPDGTEIPILSSSHRPVPSNRFGKLHAHDDADLPALTNDDFEDIPVVPAESLQPARLGLDDGDPFGGSSLTESGLGPAGLSFGSSEGLLGTPLNPAVFRKRQIRPEVAAARAAAQQAQAARLRDVQEGEQGSIDAEIKRDPSIAGADKGLTANYSGFVAQRISEQRMEKTQIIETFGDSYIFFFGEKPRFMNVQGVLFNTRDFNWRAEFWSNYENRLRGTKLVERNARLYFMYDTRIVEGYMVNASADEVADRPYMLNFSFQIFVTNVTDTSDVGSTKYPSHFQEGELGDISQYGPMGRQDVLGPLNTIQLGRTASLGGLTTAIAGGSSTDEVRARNAEAVNNFGKNSMIKAIARGVQGFVNGGLASGLLAASPETRAAFDNYKRLITGRQHVVPGGVAGFLDNAAAANAGFAPGSGPQSVLAGVGENTRPRRGLRSKIHHNFDEYPEFQPDDSTLAAQRAAYLKYLRDQRNNATNADTRDGEIRAKLAALGGIAGIGGAALDAPSGAQRFATRIAFGVGQIAATVAINAVGQLIEDAEKRARFMAVRNPGGKPPPGTTFGEPSHEMLKKRGMQREIFGGKGKVGEDFAGTVSAVEIDQRRQLSRGVPLGATRQEILNAAIEVTDSGFVTNDSAFGTRGDTVRFGSKATPGIPGRDLALDTVGITDTRTKLVRDGLGAPTGIPGEDIPLNVIARQEMIDRITTVREGGGDAGVLGVDLAETFPAFARDRGSLVRGAGISFAEALSNSRRVRERGAIPGRAGTTSQLVDPLGAPDIPQDENPFA